MTPRQLRELADELFKKKAPLNSLWQEIADNFYPERADFTTTRSVGTDFAANLLSSYPVWCRRELGNQVGTMLRPTARPWFHPRRRYEEKESSDVRAHLEWFEETQRRAMYDQRALFTRAGKEADHDFAAFGQYAKSIELNKDKNGMLYRCWHLRDMAWQEDEEGKIGFRVRKWKPTVQTLVKTFGESKLDDKVKRLNDKKPFEEIEVYHMIVPADMYDDRTMCPRWSIYYDCEHGKLIEATAIWGQHYIIPRWQTVSSSPYSYSPATVCALPDARLIQAMTLTLLEAGEKATRPPMLATKNTVKSDFALYAGGITWVDQDYDERLGAALRPLEQDFRGFNYGLEMNQDTRGLLEAAFFLNKLKPFNPATDPKMTAFQAGQLVQEYIRGALPLFEPMEMECNAAECDETFELMWRNGGFGPVENWPAELRQTDGRMWSASEEISFTFESPLHDAIEQQKGQKFLESVQLVSAALGLDPQGTQGSQFVMDGVTALREALECIGAPATWIHDQAAVDQAKSATQAAAQTQAKLAALEQAAGAVKDFGQSGLMPQGAPVV